MNPFHPVINQNPGGLTRTLLWKFSLRHWRSAPRQSALLVLILALGIAVFFSIRVANEATLASFQNFTDLITRQSDWIISAPAGLLPETILPELRERFGANPVAIIPVFETTAARPETNADNAIGSGETLQLLGLDLIVAQNFAARSPGHESKEAPDYLGSEKKNGRSSDVLHHPRAVFISDALAKRDGLNTGDSLDVVLNENIARLEIAGIIPASAGGPQAPPNLLLMDLPAIQRLAGHPGMISRVEFIVEPGPLAEARRAELKSRLDSLSRGRWLVYSPADRRSSAAAMTRAFRTNLTILSLIALVVGLYLIFQALDGAVVRRREEIGILRSLGVEERVIRRVWLLEAAVLGLIGGSLGILLGWAGAQFSVRVVGRTVNALYYATSLDSARITAGEFIITLLLAIVASLVAGWIPARAAARTPPAQLIVRHALAPGGGRIWAAQWLGVALGLAGVGLVFLPPLRFEGGMRFPLAGYLAALCWIAGGGILAGGTLRGFALMARPVGNGLIAVKIAAGHLVNPSGRHRMAVAGLVCAVAMTAGMMILVGSFDATMRGWIERTFQADLYISSSGAQSASTENRISPETWRSLVAQPAVAAANVLQTYEVQLTNGTTMLSGAELGVMQGRTRLSWAQPPLANDVFDFTKNSGLALVSESFSERFRLRRGDRLAVPTPAGEKSLVIAGVFSDYGNERGSILVERRYLAEWFRDEQASALIIFLREGFPAETVRAEWTARHPGLRILGNAYLRSEILRIFRQTFAITYALEFIGIIVAVAGLGMTLASVLVERRAELTTLRALGLSRGEIARATAGEGMLLAVSGLMVGLLVSVALGWILIYIINKQTFGWTLGFEIPGREMAALSLVVIGAGTAVAYGVGRWGADLPADREE